MYHCSWRRDTLGHASKWDAFGISLCAAMHYSMLFLLALRVDEISVYIGGLCSQIAQCQESSPTRRTYTRMISTAW